LAKNDDGEFELILGNRQLLGVFFIVIMLLAVFFAMGYIVGRNSAPLITADTTGHKPDVKPLVVDSPAPAASPTTPEASAEPAPKQADAPAPSKKEKPPEKEKPPPKREEPAKVERPSPISSNQPESGKTYLQLAATRKPDADAMVDLLRKNGFKALDYQVPEKPALYRVLVGPVPDGEINKMRADLQAKSFSGDHAVIHKIN
jgi:hypothetical protein